MKKLLLILFCLALALAGCKKAPERAAASGGDPGEAGAMVSLEINQLMKEALETDDFKTLNGKLDALMEKFSSDENIKPSIYGAKFMALLFDEDFQGLEKMVEDMDDPDLRAEYEGYVGDEHPSGAIKLTKARFCYSFGLEERGDAIVEDIVKNEESKVFKQMALIMSGKKYYEKKDVENFKKIIEAVIAVDPTNMISRSFSEDMDLVIEKMMSEEEDGEVPEQF